MEGPERRFLKPLQLCRTKGENVANHACRQYDLLCRLIDPKKAISFCDADDGWAVGEAGYTYHTSDGGQTWERLDIGV